MKIKNLLVSGIFGILASAATLATPQNIYISGAPAGKAYFSQAIYDALGGSANTAVSYAFSSSSLATVTSGNAFLYSNALIFFGGTVNGTAVTVYVSYPGSSAGIQDLATPGKLTAPYLSSTDTAAGAAAANGYADPTKTPVPSSQNNPQYPDFTCSDEFQASTPWLGTNNLTGTSYNYASLDSDVVGVIPYRFVASPDAPTSLTNITPQQAQVLWTSGYLYLSQLTGNVSDAKTAIYAIGRDIGSGLRTVLLAETGIGGPNSGVTQFEPTVSGASAYNYVTSGQQLYPAETVNGVPLSLGDGGYSSFSGILPAIASYTYTHGASLTGGNANNYPATSATNAIYVTALDDADAVNVVQNYGAHELAYNGFYAYGSGQGTELPSGGGGSNAVNNGQYTFWSYLQLQYLPALKSNPGSDPRVALAYSFEQGVKTELTNQDSPILLKNMNVSRETDGGNIFQGPDNYPGAP